MAGTPVPQGQEPAIVAALTQVLGVNVVAIGGNSPRPSSAGTGVIILLSPDSSGSAWRLIRELLSVSPNLDFLPSLMSFDCCVWVREVLRAFSVPSRLVSGN